MSNLTQPLDSIPLSVTLPWNQAYPYYYWAWYLSLLINYIGAFLNCLVIYFFLSSGNKIVESKEATVLICSLSIVDILQGLWHGTIALGSLIAQSFIAPSEALCSIDAIMAGGLLLVSLGIMDLMSMHLYIRLTKPVKKNLPLLYIYPPLVVFSIGITAICVMVPGGGILSSSGLLCIAKFQEPTTYMFCGIVVVMMSVVGTMYVGIYRYYKMITLHNKDSRISTRKRRLLVRFTLITAVSFGTFGPYAIELLYAWATSLYPPGYFEVFGILVMNLTTISNPVIYFYSNPAAVKELKFRFGVISEMSSSSTGADTSTATTTLEHFQPSTTCCSRYRHRW